MYSRDFFRDLIGEYTPYIATLYFIEVIYLMFMINFIFGKTAAVVSGASISFLLSYHIISLFNRKNLNRKIQLFLMDIHFAYSIGFLFSSFFTDFNLSGWETGLSFYRFIIALLEIPMIIFLTDEFIIKRFR